MGRVNVQAMLRTITAKQFTEWTAYAQLEPFGDRRADWRSASICELIFNTHVAKKDQRPMKDFLLAFKDQTAEAPAAPPKQSWEEQLAIAHVFALAQAARHVETTP